jgi:hypothetical protein
MRELNGNKRGEGLVQSKSILWIIGIMVLAGLVILIFQFDLFGYIKNLPSFGQTDIGTEEVDLDDMLTGIRCENFVGGIGNKVVLSSVGGIVGAGYRYNFVIGKDLLKEKEKKTGDSLRKIVVDMEAEGGPELLYVYDVGTFWDSEIAIGKFDANSKRFIAASGFNNLCEDFFSKSGTNFVSKEHFWEKKWGKEFIDEYSCGFLQRLHGAQIIGSRALCLGNVEIERVLKNELVESCKLQNVYGSLTKINDESGKVLVRIADSKCENPSTNPIGINFGNGVSIGFFWNALEKKVYARYEGDKKVKVNLPLDYEFLKDKENSCKDYFPGLYCEGGHFDRILGILEQNSFDSFVMKLVEVAGNGAFTGEFKGKKGVTGEMVKEKILKERGDYLISWVNESPKCKNSEPRYFCDFFGKKGLCEIQGCSFCFVGEYSEVDGVKNLFAEGHSAEIKNKRVSLPDGEHLFKNVIFLDGEEILLELSSDSLLYGANYDGDLFYDSKEVGKIKDNVIFFNDGGYEHLLALESWGEDLNEIYSSYGGENFVKLIRILDRGKINEEGKIIIRTFENGVKVPSNPTCLNKLCLCPVHYKEGYKIYFSIGNKEYFKEIGKDYSSENPLVESS